VQVPYLQISFLPTASY